MIYVQAAGGLGNQLFIWNLAHYLEYKFDERITIVFSKMSDNRKNELDFVKQYCSHRIQIKHSKTIPLLFRVFDKVKNHSGIFYAFFVKLFNIYETEKPSDSFKMTVKPTLVRGYFQDPNIVDSTINRYFGELKQATNFKNEISENKYRAVHIRRGDFLENRETVGLLTLNYFKRQVDENILTIICTDANSHDENLVRNFSNLEIFGSDRITTWESFSLLANSNELIASNSTFSWWAGVIVERKGGNVKVPNPWTVKPIYGTNYLYYPKFQTLTAEYEIL